ncbi:MAG: hypothetical protein R3B93_14870, partial [Bacteroidia bacterium]
SVEEKDETDIEKLKPPSLKSVLRNTLYTELSNLLDTGGAQGAVLSFAAAEMTVGEMYQSLSNLLSCTPGFEKLISSLNTDSITSAQNITTANVALNLFIEKYAQLPEVWKNASGEDGYTFNIIKSQMGDPSKGINGGGISPIVDAINPSQPTSNLALAELNAVKTVSQAAGLKFSTNTFSNDQSDAISAASKLFSDTQAGFSAAMRALTRDMETYSQDLQTYMQDEHSIQVAEVLQVAIENAKEDINVILDKAVPSFPKSSKND